MARGKSEWLFKKLTSKAPLILALLQGARLNNQSNMVNGDVRRSIATPNISENSNNRARLYACIGLYVVDIIRSACLAEYKKLRQIEGVFYFTRVVKFLAYSRTRTRTDYMRLLSGTVKYRGWSALKDP